jgi:hypothetical protein
MCESEIVFYFCLRPFQNVMFFNSNFWGAHHTQVLFLYLELYKANRVHSSGLFCFSDIIRFVKAH